MKRRTLLARIAPALLLALAAPSLFAPSLFLMLGFALRGTLLLPASFSAVALVLGGAFEILGLVSLFSTAALLLVIVVLMAQNVWSIAAALVLALRSAKPVVA